MITDDKKREYVRRLVLARVRLLNTHGFYGLLLMHSEFALDFEIETAATDGDKIYFGGTISSGIGKPGAEGHAEWGYTKNIEATKFNLFSLVDALYNKIMEW